MRDRKYENWFLSYQTDNEAGATGATLAAFKLHTFHGSLLPSFRPIHLFSPPLIPSSLPFLQGARKPTIDIHNVAKNLWHLTIYKSSYAIQFVQIPKFSVAYT